MNTQDNRNERWGTDRAASPTIGVVLIIGITVVLATVMGATVLDTTNQMKKGNAAGVDVTFESDDAGGGSVTARFVESAYTRYLEVDVEVDGSNSVSVASGDTKLESTGDEVTFEEDASNPDQQISVTVTVTGVSEENDRTLIVKQTDTI